MTGIAPDLLAWWDRHGRKDLPWQRDPTPYRVWVSEVMLQQTQVATVERYYDRFLQSFPTVTALADAPADAVLHAWSGLGYYSRARNLHRAAQRVRDQHGGVVPATFEALADLPGIGRSTAGAILALATGQRFPILDGNVKRVLARVHRIEGSPVEPAVLKQMWAMAEANTPADRAAHYTQAVMDLGATLCTRRKPACPRCPLAARCAGLAAGIAERLPAAKPRRARPLRATVVMLVRHGPTRVLLEKRPDAGIWGGLWGLPEVAATADVPGWCAQALGTAPGRLTVRPVLRHGFTHFDLDMTPVEVEVAPAAGLAEGERWLWYDVATPAKVGLAAPVAKLLRGLAEPGLFQWPGGPPGRRPAVPTPYNGPDPILDPNTPSRDAPMPRTVHCVLLKTEADGLDYVPYPGPLGKRIFENVSKAAWQQWLAHQTMLINEYRLTPIEPKARQYLEAEMEKFFFGGGSEKPPDFKTG